MLYEVAAPAVVVMPSRSTPCSESKRRAISPSGSSPTLEQTLVGVPAAARASPVFATHPPRVSCAEPIS